MAKRKGSPVSREGTSSQRESESKVDRDAREAEDAKLLLDKLPQEIWEKILDDVDENDLFPLALSCKCFNQMQTVREELLRIKWMKIERMMKVFMDAGESSFSHSSLFWVLTSFSSSQRAEADGKFCRGSGAKSILHLIWPLKGLVNGQLRRVILMCSNSCMRMAAPGMR